MINIGPRDIEAVLAVARHRSFVAAASDLGISQPSVSARIRHAEDVLGVKLFNRTTRQVSVTGHGERLIVRIEQSLAELRSLVQEFKDESRLKRGRVVIGATPAIASSLLPQILQRFCRRWPGIEVVLRDDFFGRVLDRVQLGEVDFAVTPSADYDDRFACQLLTFDEYLLVAHQDHPLVKERTITLLKAAKYPLLTLPTGTATREMLSAAYAAKGLDFQPAFETHNMASVFAMVKAEFGFAFMPSSILSVFNMDGMKTARVRSASLGLAVTITKARGRAIQPAAETLIDAILLGVGKGPIRLPGEADRMRSS